MEMIPSIMATGAVLVGLVFVGLILQITYHVRSSQINQQLNRIESLLSQLLIDQEIRSVGSPVTLEDMIQRDLQEQMNKEFPLEAFYHFDEVSEQAIADWNKKMANHGWKNNDIETKEVTK